MSHPDLITVEALEEELKGLVQSVASVSSDLVQSVFDLDDMVRLTGLQAFPCVGVSYNASFPYGGRKDSYSADGESSSVLMADHQFIVIVGVEYQYAGQGDNKIVALRLLDSLRKAILGHIGVNTRPWRWLGDRPEPAASIEGVSLYSQIWHTAVPALSNYGRT